MVSDLLYYLQALYSTTSNITLSYCLISQFGLHYISRHCFHLGSNLNIELDKWFPFLNLPQKISNTSAMEICQKLGILHDTTTVEMIYAYVAYK
jgi:hypothetical protein